jgi:hypothetical protein
MVFPPSAKVFATQPEDPMALLHAWRDAQA